MRTALLLTTLSLVTVFGVACSDANSGSDLSRRYNAQGTDDPNAPHDATDSDIGQQGTPDPGGTAQPGQPGNPGTAAATFDMAISNATPQGDLGTEVSFDVTITPKAALAAPVALTVTGLPTNVTATFTPASVQTTGTTPAKATVKLDIPYTAQVTPKAAPVALVFTGSASGATATANANFKVNAQMTIAIPMNAGALRSTQTIYRDQWGSAAFGATPTPLLTQADNPISVLVKNDDSVPNEIHSGGTFGHGQGNIAPGGLDQLNGATRIRQVKVNTTSNGYLHNDGPTQGDGKGVSFQIKVAP